MPNPVKFWDRLAVKYSKQPVADEGSYQKKLSVTREYLRPDMEVLEFGCGTGSTAITQAGFVKHITATDASPKMIEIARAKAEGANVSNVTFACTGIEELDAPVQSFDAVFGFSILHLVEDKDFVVSKVYDLLKPGGVFVSSTVCIVGLMRLFGVILPIGKLFGVLPHVLFFTPQELADSLTRQGFVIDHQWQPGKGKAVFIVAKKPDQTMT